MSDGTSKAALILSVIAIIIVIGIILFVIFSETGRDEIEALIVWTIQEGGSSTTESITPTNNFLYINGATVTSVTLNPIGNNKGDYFQIQNSSSSNTLDVAPGSGVTLTQGNSTQIATSATATFIWRSNTEINRLT